MLLAGDGHRVTVVERDPAPVPDTAAAAFDGWARRGVNQFLYPHLALGTALLVDVLWRWELYGPPAVSAPSP
jgi:hypothetical protein